MIFFCLHRITNLICCTFLGFIITKITILFCFEKKKYILYVINTSTSILIPTAHYNKTCTLLPELIYPEIKLIHTKKLWPDRWHTKIVTMSELIFCRPMDWHVLENTQPVRFHRSQPTPAYLLNNTHTKYKYIHKKKLFIFVHQKIKNKNKHSFTAIDRRNNFVFDFFFWFFFLI